MARIVGSVALRPCCATCVSYAEGKLKKVKNARAAEKKAELTPQSTFRSSLHESRQRKSLGVDPREPFKGVKSLMSVHRSAEPLEKGILRQKHGLHTFKDGTIRFDATNEPLTHFKPVWISVSIDKLRELWIHT